ncbi:hypothetical protein [Wolbachia endosymbiont (group B) of Limnophora tigrina]|uniref:hypothetical protein n=1 Tax=Wolbachia endosymbiont (group B) of Limnophora tigrina TaxID=3139317 RepID=UPI0035B569EF
MKNIFNKTNAPYLAVGVLATLTLLASGVFAVAPYAQFLAPVAALSVGLPFIISGAIISAVVVALSSVAISKNKTISQQEKFESCVAQRKQEEENGRAELEAKGLLPDVIALPEISRQENFSNRMAQRKQEEEKERAELKAKGLLPDIIALPYKDTETPSPENEPAKEENGQGWGAWIKSFFTSTEVSHPSNEGKSL